MTLAVIYSNSQESPLISFINITAKNDKQKCVTHRYINKLNIYFDAEVYLNFDQLLRCTSAHQGAEINPANTQSSAKLDHQLS